MSVLAYMREAGKQWVALWVAYCFVAGFWLWPTFLEILGEAISYDADMGWLARLGCTAIFVWGSDSGYTWVLLAVVTFLGIM